MNKGPPIVVYNILRLASLECVRCGSTAQISNANKHERHNVHNFKKNYKHTAISDGNIHLLLLRRKQQVLEWMNGTRRPPLHDLRVQSRACGMIYRDRRNIALCIIWNTTGSFVPSGSVRWHSIPGSVCMDTNGSKDPVVSDTYSSVGFVGVRANGQAKRARRRERERERERVGRSRKEHWAGSSGCG